MNPETPHGAPAALSDRTPKQQPLEPSHLSHLHKLQGHRADSMPTQNLDQSVGPPDGFVRSSTGIQPFPPQDGAWKCLLMNCTNVPRMDILSDTDSYVTLTVQRNGVPQGNNRPTDRPTDRP